ncbi:MAG: hypothetical protein A2X00_00135 [Bacteroidetes bacterium GWE2_32_14]|nr:MAG: hypothetical protein A2X00_00135 [Bacteroidetes bacterium GWE2_32_14]
MNSDTISEFKWIKDITIKTESFATDQLNNIYSIDKTGVVKISIEDQSRFSYSSKLNGNIHSVDVTDPFRILIFYKDFSRAVFLDNKLTELLSAIQLNDLGYFNVQAVGTSSRGGFWIYDQDVAQIVYIDKSLKESHRSSVLRDIIDNSSDKETLSLIEKNDFVYLGIPNQGIFQFDIYGTFLKKFPITDFFKFQVWGQSIIYFSNNKLKIYNTQTYETEEKILPVNNVKDCSVEGSKLFLLLTDRISIYSINN